MTLLFLRIIILAFLLLSLCQGKEDYFDSLDDKACVSALVKGSYDSCEDTIDNMVIQGVCEINTCADKTKNIMYVRNRTGEVKSVLEAGIQSACDSTTLERYVCIKMNTTRIRCYSRKIPSNGDLEWKIVESIQPDPLVDELLITKIPELNLAGDITNCGFKDKRLYPILPKSTKLLCNLATSFPLTCDPGFIIDIQGATLSCATTMCLSDPGGNPSISAATLASHPCQGRQSCNFQRPDLCTYRTLGDIHYKCMPA